MKRDYVYNFERGESVQFHLFDYIIFGATLLISACIGLYFAIKGRRNKDTNEYLLAGRKLSVIPVSLSLVSTFISAITLLGTPAEVYVNNTMYWWVTIGFIVTGTGSAHIFIPVFYRLQITSVFEYIDMRFGKACRIAASLTYLLWIMLYMSIVLYGPSLALNAVTGLSLWGSTFAVGLVCIFYTTLGGMKAVVWTDTFQTMVMFTGMFLLLIMGSMKLGGLDIAWDIAKDNERIVFSEIGFDPTTRHTVWNLVIGGGIVWAAAYSINQALVQRAISLPSIKHAQLAIWLNFPGMLIIISLVCLVGIVMYAYYATCDPVTLGIIGKSDQLIPLFSMDLLGQAHGLPGLVMSCIFSGSLSTMSSGLNAVAAVMLQDYIKPYCCKNISTVNATIFSKITVVVCGLVCLALAFLVSNFGGIQQLSYSIFGVLAGPLLGLFTLGVLFPWSNKWGGLTGLLTSLGFLVWIACGKTFLKVVVTPPLPVYITGCNVTRIPNNYNTSITNFQTASIEPYTETSTASHIEKDETLVIYKLSYMWYIGLAILTTVLVGLIVSLVTGPTDPTELDPRMICPFFDTFFPFLPEKLKCKLRFGVRHYDEKFIATFVEKQTKQNEGNSSSEGIDNPVLDVSDMELRVEKEQQNSSVNYTYQTKL